jgi:ABC-type transporter Mla subunit MlaD
MPTQEERVTALEQKTAAHIQEIDENTTIMLGVMRHQGQDIKRIFQHLETMNETLNTLGRQINQLDTRLNRLETKFDEHTSLLTQILERLPQTP